MNINNLMYLRSVDPNHLAQYKTDLHIYTRFSTPSSSPQLYLVTRPDLCVTMQNANPVEIIRYYEI